MTPIKSILLSGAAATALLAAPVYAQSLNVESDTDADASITSESLENSAETAAEGAEDTLKKTGEAVEDTAEATGEAIEDGANATEDAATNTAEALTPDADAEANAEAGATASAEGVTAGTLIGTQVAAASGEEIGEIDDVVRENGETMVVIGVGGFLGLGEHRVALPISDLDWQGENVTAIGYTQQQLESMEEFNSETAIRLEAEEPIDFDQS